MTSAPVMSLSFREPGFNQDPFRVLEQIRQAGPVVFNELRGTWLLTSYPDAARVLGDVRHYAQGETEAFTDFFGGPTMETIDVPERHDAIRGIWAEDFQRGNLESRRPLVERVVAERLDPFVERVRAGETVDAVAEMTRSIPTLVIAPSVAPGTQVAARLDHYAMLRATQEMLNVTPLLGSAATAADMRTPFNLSS